MLSRVACGNLQLGRQQVSRRRVLRGVLASVCAVTVLAFVCLAALDGSYLGWNLGDPETAVAAASLHAFERAFALAALLLHTPELPFWASAVHGESRQRAT